MNFISKMLTADGDNNPSSKRTIAFLAFLLLCIAFVAELVYGMKVGQPIIDAMMYIIVGGFGFTSVEKFVKKEEKK